MSCGNKLDTCGKKSFANCVNHEGNIAEHGNLTSCDCHSVQDVLDDLVDMADTAYEQTHLTLTGCLEFEKDKEGKVLNSDAVQTIVNKICELIDHTGLDAAENCPECVDPCEATSSNCCEGGVVYAGYTSGEIFINTSNATNWTAITTSGYNLEYTATKDGNYKVTLDVGCVVEDPNGRAWIGIGVNTVSPESGNPFSEYQLIPDFNSKTVHFFLRNIKKNDILKLKFKATAASISVDGVKMIIEKS